MVFKLSRMTELLCELVPDEFEEDVGMAQIAG